MSNKVFFIIIIPFIISVVVSGLVSLFLYLTNCGTGELIEGTGFIESEASLKGSDNFDIDSNGNFYFCSDDVRLIQVYDSNSEFKYSIPLPKNIGGKGSKWIRVNSDDTVDFFYESSSETEIWHYDKNGF